jgi:hypothetical protein
MFESVILIDDDILVRDFWQRRLRRTSSNFRAFAGVDDFNRARQGILRTSAFFVDRHLGEGYSGLDLAHEIYEDGFSNVFLCTEDSDLSLKNLPWISGVIGKTPPSWLTDSQWSTPITSEERASFTKSMSATQQALYQKRMEQFMGVIYGGEGAGLGGLFEDGFGLPQEVLNSWERGILLSLSDEDIKQVTDKAWRELRG